MKILTFIGEYATIKQINFQDEIAGLRILLAAYKKLKAAKGTMKLINVGQNFTEVLQNTGLDAVFDIQ
ncbi:MAG: hypothetical protein J5956_06560 [Ruminococcus sp.]|nr:hypothetical protein [Ruminococcus sp.]